MVYRDQGRPCPSCRGPFFAEGEGDGEERFECHHCGARILSLASLQARAPKLTQILMLAVAVKTVVPRYCPRCGDGMRGMGIDSHDSIGTVALDVCDAHGVWFDRAEFETLALHAGDRTGRNE